MPTHDDVITEARSWIGTPYHHQQCAKGHGVDCGMLVVGVGHALGLAEMIPLNVRRWGRRANPNHVRANLEQFMVEIPPEEVRFGDVFWIAWRTGVPLHLGFYTDLHGAGMIHPLQTAGRVIETAFTADDRQKVEVWWRFKNLCNAGANT